MTLIHCIEEHSFRESIETEYKFKDVPRNPRMSMGMTGTMRGHISWLCMLGHYMYMQDG